MKSHSKKIIMFLIVLCICIILFSLSIAEAEDIDTICIIGDSLTFPGKYANALSRNITDGKKVESFGQGSIDCQNMIAVQGGITLLVDPFDIPADTKPVEINLYTYIDEKSVGSLGIWSTQGINPVYIDGVEGVISTTHDNVGKNKKYYFKRKEAGEAYSITRPSVVHTELMNHYRNSILVIWLGANDAGKYKNTIDDAKKMATDLYYYIMQAVSYNGNDKYIVIGLTVPPQILVDEVNKNLAKMFGYHFIDLKSYLVEYGLFDAGITPTSKDLKSIAEGYVPCSLIQDDMVHFRDIGYEVIGNLIYKKGVDIGYWK